VVVDKVWSPLSSPVTCSSPDPRLATELRLFLSALDLFDKPTSYLPSSLHPALIAPPLIQQPTVFYIFARVISLLMQSGSIHRA